MGIFRSSEKKNCQSFVIEKKIENFSLFGKEFREI